MNIHQLSVSHDEREDRLQLKLNTQDGVEFRFWLTRRMALRLLPAMEKSLDRVEASKSGIAASNPPAQRMLTELKREAFLQTADFSTPYSASPPKERPLGEEPLLVTDAQMSLLPQGALQIIFQNKGGESNPSCQLRLHSQLVHGMIHLIRQCMKKADWVLDTTVGEELPEKSRAFAMKTPEYKH